MSRSHTITEALSGAVVFGDITPEQGRRALLSGLPADLPCFPATVAGAKRAGEVLASEARALLLPEPLISHKAGAFWGPQPWDAAKALRLADAHKKGRAYALRWGAGVRSNPTVGALACLAVECDSQTLPQQAATLDRLEREHGIRASLVVMSGDTRPASLRAAELRAGASVETGKSLHVYLPIHAVDVGNPDHARALNALCVLLRADLAATDPSRLLRAPGVVATSWGPVDGRRVRKGERVRVQTVLRAEESPCDVRELADALEGACEAWGLDVAEGLQALRGAAGLRRAASGEGVEDAALLLAVAAEMEASAKISPAAAELLRTAGAGRGKRAKGGGRAGLLRYARGMLDRDTPVRVMLKSGVVETRRLAAWRCELELLDLGEASEGRTKGLAAWAPTNAGLYHTSGDDLGKPRETPAATIWVDDDGVRLSCHVEKVVYVPTRPPDPAATPPPMPAKGESPYLALDLAPGVHVLRSDTGTGKTHGLIAALGDGSRLIVSPRVAIASEAARRYKVRSYLADVGDLVCGDDACGLPQSVSVCVNSLCRVEYTGRGSFWLIIEESEQVAAAFPGGTIPLFPGDGRAHARAVLDKLRELTAEAIASGGGVVAADAFAGDLTRALLSACVKEGTPIKEHGIARRRDLPVRLFARELDGKGRTLATEQVAMLAELKRRVAAGERWTVACFNASDALAWAEVLASVQRTDGRLARVKVYVSDEEATCGQGARAPLDELQDVNRHWGPEECDVVLYSPVASAAVSYDRARGGERFDGAALAAPWAPHGGWDLGVQMLDRARSVGEVWIAAPQRDASCVADLETQRRRLRDKWNEDVRAVAAAMGFDYAAREPESPELLNIAATRAYVAELRNADVRGDLARYFEARGATVTQATAQGGDDMRKAIADARKRRGEAWALMVCEADVLRDQREADALSRELSTRYASGRAAIPQGEEADKALASLCSWELRERYGPEHLRPDLVTDDKHDRVWEQTQALVRAGLIADGQTRAAVGETTRRAVEAGCEAGGTARTAKAMARVLLLRCAMGDRWLAELLDPLREDGEGEGAPLLAEPLARAGGVRELRARKWSAATWDGESLASDYANALRERGINPAVLAGTGAARGGVARDPVKAVGDALAAMGLRTRKKRDGSGERRRWLALDLERWRARCALAERLKKRKRAGGFAPSTPGHRASEPLIDPGVWTGRAEPPRLPGEGPSLTAYEECQRWARVPSPPPLRAGPRSGGPGVR